MPMLFNLTRPLAFIDLETTGTDKVKDRITEIAIIKMFPNGIRRTFASLVNPGRLLSDELVELTGITNEQLAAAPVFGVIAKEVHDILYGCDIAGFGAEDFDTPLLWEELYREGIEWDVADVKVVDGLNIFRKKESRNLTAAVRFYLDEDHSGAHRAMADTAATFDVMHAQLERYPELPRTVPELAAETAYAGRRVDLAGKLATNDQGVIVFTFGKNKGAPFKDNINYAQWMLREDTFSLQTKMVIRKLMGSPFDIRAPAHDAPAQPLRPHSTPTEREDLTLPL